LAQSKPFEINLSTCLIAVGHANSDYTFQLTVFFLRIILSRSFARKLNCDF